MAEVATKSPKTKKSTPATKESNGGLRKPQYRILKALAKANKPLTRAVIAEKAPVDVAGCTEWIGSCDEAKRKVNDAKFFPSLITLGLVKEIIDDSKEGAANSNGEVRYGTAYILTAKGKAVAAKA